MNKGDPLPSNPNQILYSIAQKSPDAFIKNSKNADRWVEQWGLGFPDSTKLVGALAAFDEKNLLAVSDFPIATVPFGIIIVPLLFIVIVGVMLELLSMTIRRVKRLKSNLNYRTIKNCADALQYPAIAIALLSSLAAITTIIVMQIPTNMVNGAFPNKPLALFMSLLTSRLFAFLVLGITFSSLFFKHIKKKLDGLDKELNSPGTREDGEKEHDQLG